MCTPSNLNEETCSITLLHINRPMLEGGSLLILPIYVEFRIQNRFLTTRIFQIFLKHLIRFVSTILGTNNLNSADVPLSNKLITCIFRLCQVHYFHFDMTSYSTTQSYCRAVLFIRNCQVI